MAILTATSHWDGEFPVDAAKIARALGVEVNICPEMDARLLGRFELTNGLARIVVNASSDETVQRFAVAHELGHYLLRHGDFFEDTSESFDPQPRRVRDWQANEFARELLMPAFAFEVLIMKRNMIETRRMLTFFGVSITNLEVRLERLRWIPSKRVREAPIRAMEAELRRMERQARYLPRMYRP
jgi:Zn-dependent peptidase ImmA (M78 family)